MLQSSDQVSKIKISDRSPLSDDKEERTATLCHNSTQQSRSVSPTKVFRINKVSNDVKTTYKNTNKDASSAAEKADPTIVVKEEIQVNRFEGAIKVAPPTIFNH